MSKRRYTRKLLGCFELVFFTVLIWVIKPHIVWAENSVAQLTIHAFGDSLGSSGGNVGHAFLTIQNLSNRTLNFADYPIEPQKIISVSIWPDSMGYGGVYINREMIVNKGIKTVSLSVDITKNQFKKIASMASEESYYHDGMNDLIANPWDDLWHNCTTYSTEMWNMVAPQKYQISDGFAGIDAPKWIVKKIRTKSGYQEKEFIHHQSIDWTDVFYLSKEGDLIPTRIEKPSLKCENKTNNSITLSWTSSTKYLLNGKKNVTEYLIHYYPTDAPQNYKSKRVSSDKVKITGLQSGKKYKFLVCAIYEKGQYKENSAFSNELSVTTEKSEKKASIKLNKTSAAIYVKKSLQLKAEATGESNTISWKSSNTSIATVKNGKVTAKKVGTVTISASANGVSATCKIKVKKQPSLESFKQINVSSSPVIGKVKYSYYYNSSKGTYSIKETKNGTTKTLVSNIAGFTSLTDGTYLFYSTGIPGEYNTYTIWRYKISSGKKERIIAGRCYYPIYCDGTYLYYGSGLQYGGVVSPLNVMNLKNRKNVSTGFSVSHMKTINGKILASGQGMPHGGPFFLMNKDGTNINKITNEYVYNFRISGKYIYYTEVTYTWEFRECRCDLNGKNSEALESWHRSRSLIR